MIDQAADLRQLVLHRAHTLEPVDAPHLICVSGGKRGVGATTLAVNLAIGLARDGRRTALIDADLGGGSVATLCGLTDGYRVSDVLAGSRTLHEALQLGPAGILVLDGVGPQPLAGEIAEASLERFIAQLRGLHPHIDYVVLDTGCRASRAAAHLWRAADSVLLTTSPEVEAIMDTYGLVKQLAAHVTQARLVSLVNFAPNALTAADVHERLSRACHRFLDLDVTRGSWLPIDPALAGSDSLGPRLLLEQPQTAAARSIDQLVETLVAQLAAPSRAPVAAAS